MTERPYRRNVEREEAISLGNKTYFTGKPCRNGHIAERRVSSWTCVQCAKEIHHIKDREKYRDPANTFFRQFHHRRQVAEKEGIPFTITFDELLKPEFCPVLGVKLNYGCSTGKDGKQTRDPNKASIDKVVPELGYVPGNVFVISWKANKLKSDMTVEQLEKILDYMKRNIENGKAV
jgi:hypothetical protein